MPRGVTSSIPGSDPDGPGANPGEAANFQGFSTRQRPADVLPRLILSNADSFVVIWLAALNGADFGAFALDKWCAKRSARRVPEVSLLLLGALGGWPGGLLGMNVFRHKTAKRSFQFKWALALIPFAAEIWLWLHWR